MNIFKFELKKLYAQIIIWTISLCSVFGFFITMYPTYSDNKEAVTRVFASYPKQMLDALGVNLNTMFTFNGFYSFILNYLLLVAAIMALYFSISIFAREKKAKTSDFLFTMPISRKKIFLSKLAVSSVVLLIINLIYLVFSIFMYSLIAGDNTNYQAFLLITGSLVIVELIFYSGGIFLATTLKKVKNIGGMANSIGFVFFIIAMAAGIINKDWLNYITPFKYFDPMDIIRNNQYSLNYVLLSISLIIGFLIISFNRYVKNDIDNV